MISFIGVLVISKLVIIVLIIIGLLLIGNSSVWLNFNQHMNNKIHHYSWKEHVKISNIAKFG